MNELVQKENTSFKGRYLLLLVLYVLINLVFQGVSFYFEYKRYFFSAEILLALLLFALRLNWAGSVALVGAVILEMALGLSSMFPLFEGAQLWDMVEFVFEAKTSYLAALALLLAIMALAIKIAVHVPKGLQRKPLVLIKIAVGLLFFQCQWVLSSGHDTFFTPSLATRPQLLFGSAAHFTNEVMMANRLQIVGNVSDEHPDYIPIRHLSASKMFWNESAQAPRVLFIIAEAWGLPLERAALERQVKILQDNPHVKNLKVEKIHAVGTTATGELRELCGVIPTRLNFRKLTADKVGECLPEQLGNQGYATVGLHAAFGGMYRRTLWWPEIGLNETIFKENMPPADPQCFSFPGHCDRNLLDIVAKKLSGEKVFLYWLSLNSHMPYDRRDVINYRKELCDVWKSASHNEQLCGYQNLHVQFFEGLAALAQNESMRGVEVMVVGDHPPLFDNAATKALFLRDQVPALHFTIQ